MDYYTDHDPGVCRWLDTLVYFGDLPSGEVDPRCVSEITPETVAHHRRCHFFAGIGGWAHALELAGWPEDRPVWTASLPCQPFSQAGRQTGTDDDRHLWPTFRNLVEQCLPATLFGEQVASPLGRTWLASVQTDLEALGYTTAAADLCAAGIGSPHIRQRIYWCAIRVADGNGTGLEVLREQPPWRELASVERDSTVGGMVQPDGAGREPGRAATEAARYRGSSEPAGCTDPWGFIQQVPCADGKSRPIEPGIEPLVNGLPGRMGLLRGYGNAIVSQVAEVFIRSVMECLDA